MKANFWIEEKNCKGQVHATATIDGNNRKEQECISSVHQISFLHKISKPHTHVTGMESKDVFIPDIVSDPDRPLGKLAATVHPLNEKRHSDTYAGIIVKFDSR